MQRVLAWRGVATFLLLCGLVRVSHAGEPLKPYVFLIVDTSGSMDTATNFGPPSCPGSTDTRLDHAKCAIAGIANSYGDMVLGLGRFRESSTDTTPADGCAMNGIDCTACDESNGSGCTTAMASDSRLEVLTGMYDGNNSDLVTWNNFSAGTCTSTAIANNPEIYIAGWTPIAGSLKGAKRYWQGLQATDGTTLLASGQPGFDPIRNDPLKNVFLPSGRQCRPYIVISLTDGEETCTTFANTTAAASALLTTAVDARTYRIETKPIGFGVTPGNAQIEGVAHAGGAADGAGNEGLYASNEEELQVAISTILAEAVKFEQCNNLDDDCDTLIDEDFPNRGGACDNGMLGRCRGTGTYVCTASGAGTTCNITNPGATPTTEICNNIDDNCDGQIDEGLICSCSGVEICNNADDDCDGLVDESLVRGCGTDVGECSAGTQTCSAGSWGTCTGTGPTMETCNNRDDDCDGVIDGLVRDCSAIPGGNPMMGICHPGMQTCSTGSWGTCVGEVGPATESCDTIDNNCNGMVDEGTGGADCSSSCGVGQTVCTNGVLTCEGSTGGGPEVCNDFDDNCNGLIDEGVPDMGPCTTGPGGEPLCMPGVLRCVGGTYVCQGGEPAMTETCNCEDDNCNGQVDEGTLCGGGATCTHCQCALPCASGEFPCPEGRVCVDSFCIADPCFNVTCDPLPNGDQTVCDAGTCVRACDQVTCGAGEVCVGSLGECRPDNCLTFPDRCSATQQCVGGTCVDDPCAGVTCGGNQYCQGGQCVGSCTGVTCPTGERCDRGMCEADPCGGPCPGTQVCNETSHTCVNDPCLGRPCPSGEACNPQNGMCERDPCLGVTCPGANEICEQGTCFTPPPPVDAGPVDEDRVTTGGGGGCSTGGGSSGGLLVGLALALGLRRRRAARAAGGGQ